MARAEYIQPNREEWMRKFRFHSTVRVRFCETDMSGHVNNTYHLVYFEQGRTDYLEKINLYEFNLAVMTADICCHYLSEAFYMDVLQVGVRISRMGNSSLDMEYYLFCEERNTLVSTGKGTIVVVDRETKKSTPIPLEIRRRVEEIEQVRFT
jgi:acyl-CoA thioester hydrolase